MKKLIQFVSSNFQIFNIAIALLMVGSIAFWYSSQPTSQQSSSAISSLSPVNKIASVAKQSSTVNNIAPENSTTFPETSSILPLEANSNSPANISSPPVITPLPTITEDQQNINSKHFSFAEAPNERLVAVSKYYDRLEYLDQEAAQAFKIMKAEAQRQGINLVLISGFRSISTQQQLFTKQIQKQGSRKAAEKLSAPPGYSEHHTGYAVDIGDGRQPQKDLKFGFESTPAYSWLVNNAYRYGFELSFPRNNLQGISFEPWHWRYIASYSAEQIFTDSRRINLNN